MMHLYRKVNATAVVAVLMAFCFVSAFSSENSVALRGHDHGRNLENDKVSVFRCDSENRMVSSEITNKTEVLEEDGLDIRICFQASNFALANNLYILKVDDFTFTKDRNNGDLAAAGPTRQIPVIMRQKAVDHGIVMSDDFTEIFCEPGSEICAIQTRVTGYFFLTSGLIEGTGRVMMQKGFKGNRELQQMDSFEDVYIELNFTGGGRNPAAQKKKIIVIVGIVAAVLLLLCCCGVICCFAGLCCFAARGKRDEETEDGNFEEVSVKIAWDESAKKSRKSADDMSDTESLEDDKYWDDDINLSDDENEKDYYARSGKFDPEMVGAAAVPESPRRKSQSSSRRSSQRSSMIAPESPRRKSQGSSRRGSQRSTMIAPESPRRKSQGSSRRGSQRSTMIAPESPRRKSQSSSRRKSQTGSRRNSRRSQSIEDDTLWDGGTYNASFVKGDDDDDDVQDILVSPKTRKSKKKRKSSITQLSSTLE
jgi:hypothetical protein